MHIYEVDPSLKSVSVSPGTILLKDGYMAFCPFQPPITVAGDLQGTVILQRIACSTGCPLASYHEDENKPGYGIYTTLCGTIKQDITVAIREPVSHKDGKIITM